MTTHDLIPLVSSDDEEAWKAERAAHRVTASEAHTIAAGGRSTWLRVLDDKLNGSTFKGTASTKRGHQREPFLIGYAQSFVDPTIEPNHNLFVAVNDGQIAATPDGLGDGFGVEVKSLDFGGDPEVVPQNHYDQMQIGMYVTGYDRWLYVREVMGEDEEPTLDDPTYRWIDRDEQRIERLLREARAFLAWWDNGAPAFDDIPGELDDALAAHADARARKNAAASDEAAAEKIIRNHIGAIPDAETFGLKLAGSRASFVYAVSHADVLDEEAWAQAEPESFAAYQNLKARLAASVDAATELYHRPVPRTRLTITANKEAA